MNFDDAIDLVLVVALGAVCLLVSAFLVQLLWNHGVTALVDACGGHVSTIGYAPAVLLTLLLGVFVRVPA